LVMNYQAPERRTAAPRTTGPASSTSPRQNVSTPSRQVGNTFSGGSSGPGSSFPGSSSGPGSMRVVQTQPTPSPMSSPNINLQWANLPLCCACNEPISGPQTEYKGAAFHPSCFACDACRCSFQGKVPRKSPDSKFYCDSCFLNRNGVTCHACKSIINGKSMELKFGDNKVVNFHMEHFLCVRCGINLNGNRYKMDETTLELRCRKCQDELNEIDCTHCKMPIDGYPLMFVGRAYHPEHFFCYQCNALLLPNKYVEWEEQPYCTGCFKTLPDDVRQVIFQRLMVEKEKKNSQKK